MGRLFREAPVNSIWEGSGNVMCLDVLRAAAQHPEEVQAMLDQLLEVAAGEPVIRGQLEQLRKDLAQAPADAERGARRLTQKLVLCVQACLMRQHASPAAAAAFISSRYDPDWGTVLGISAGTRDVRGLLREAWEADTQGGQ